MDRNLKNPNLRIPYWFVISTSLLSHVQLSTRPGVCTYQVFLCLLVIFSCYLSIRLLFYVFLSLYFTLKFFLLPLNRLLGLSSSILHQLHGRVSFVILEFPVSVILLDPVPVSFESSLFCQYLLVYLFQSYVYACLLFCFRLFILIYP